MSIPQPARLDGARQPSPRVAAFLDAYEAHIGAIAPDEDTDLTATVDRMHMVETPFVHGTIDRFLPEALFDSVERTWLESTDLMPVALPGADYVGSRRAKLLEDTGASSPIAPGDAVWEAVALALRSPALVRLLVTRFHDTVESNLRALGDGAVGQPGFRLYQCFDQGAPEALGAHVDALRKLLTIVIYIDLDGAVDETSERLWGTALYNVAPAAVQPVHFTPNAEHQPAGHIGFARNRAFVMPNSSRALHGVAGGQSGVSRRTLMCGYWLFDDAR